jgi:hypothetical protein
VKKALAIFGLVGLTALTVNGREAVTITVSPAQAFAPATLRVVVRIEPNATNRALTIVADGESFFRSSEVSLEGDLAPKIVQMPFPNVPGGNYDVYAVLKDASGRERATAHEHVAILSVDGQ